jgi:hypothetical protein
MSYQKLPQGMIGMTLALLSLVGCAPLRATPTPPTATPEALVLQISFDGENCAYVGPTDFAPGPVKVVFSNTSGGRAAMDFLRNMEGYTIQDAVDYWGQIPSTKHHPAWSEEMGTWRYFAPGESASVWEGNLGAGTYEMVCATIDQYDSGVVWCLTGLTVKD